MAPFIKFGIYASQISEVDAGGRLYSSSDDVTTPTLYELNVDTLADINDGPAFSTSPTGIGGIVERLYHVDNGDDDERELNMDTLANINNYDNSEISAPRGFGGIGQTGILWLIDSTDDALYEIDKDDLQINSSEAMPGTNTYGVGGTYYRMFAVDFSDGTIEELNRDTRAIINSEDSGLTQARDTGGTNYRLFATAQAGGLIKEYNIDTLSDINSVLSPGLAPNGVGGTKIE